MFEFIKKLFKEETITEEVSLDSIDDWFNKKTNIIFYKINNEVSTFNIRLKSDLKKLDEELDKLEKARLKNPNIPQKMYDIMEGNRESFIKKHNHFIDSLNQPKDYADIDYFIDEAEKALNELHESTQKPYFVLHEFFEEEAYKVASNLKKIDLLVKELKDKLKEYNLRRINRLKEDIFALKSKIDLERSSKEKIKKAEEYLNDLNKERDSLNNEIEDFKNSKEFKEFSKLKEEKERLLKKKSKNNDELLHFFSNINHALKKYSRVSTDENLIKLYLEDPVKALSSDQNLKIISVLQKMKISIEQDKIELKDEKKERIIDNISSTDVSFFTNFIEEYNELKDEIAAKEKELRESEAIRNVKEMNDKLEKSKENIRRLNENIDRLHKEHDKIDVNALKDDLQADLSTAFDSSIVIKKC